MSERGAGRSERRRPRRAIVVGSGVAGMSAALELARSGIPVLLLGRTGALGSPSVCHVDGVSAAFGQGPDDTPECHFRETIVAGDFAAPQPPVRALCEAAPKIVHALDRIGVPFERTLEGRILREPVAGARGPRAARAGGCTGEQILRALDREILRREALEAVDARGQAVAGEPLIARLIPWELVGIVLDDNRVCVGVVAADLKKGTLRAFAADGVCIASGGYGALWGDSCADAWADGAAIARLFAQGALLANPEFVAWQPTALIGPNKAHALPEALRTLGARVFSAKPPAAGEALTDKERDHFLEKSFAALRGLSFADDCARAVARAEKRLSDSEARVWLDVSKLATRPSFGDLFTRLTRLTTFDPERGLVPIGARAEASLGGLWVDFETAASETLVTDSPRSHATNVPGLYAAGSAEYQYHGASRLAGNQLVASLFAGSLAARGIRAYREALDASAFDLPASLFERAEAREQARIDDRRKESDEPANPFVVRDALAELLADACGLERSDERLDRAAGELEALSERAARATRPGPLQDPACRVALALPDLVALGRAIVLAARQRAECRGSHFKPELDPAVAGSGARSAPRTTLIGTSDDGTPRLLDAFEYTSAGRPVHVSAEVDVSLLRASERGAPA